MRYGELLAQFPNVTREQLADALHWCLIGGNHLVGAVSRLFPDDIDWHELKRWEVSDMFEDGQISYEAYEAWTAWRCCMDAAESIRATGEVDV